MPRVKQASKRDRAKQALPVLRIVGVSLTLAGGASEGNAAEIARSNEITLYEEEISDISLSSFWVFDKDSAETPRLQFAQFGCRGCRGCRGCGGCRGCRAFGGGGGAGFWHGGGSRHGGYGCFHGGSIGGGGCGGVGSSRGCGGAASGQGGCGGAASSQGGCGGGGCGGGGCGGGGCGGGGCGGGGGGWGATYRAPIPSAPEDSDDQARPKAKKTSGDSKDSDDKTRLKAKTNTPRPQ